MNIAQNISLLVPSHHSQSTGRADYGVGLNPIGGDTNGRKWLILPKVSSNAHVYSLTNCMAGVHSLCIKVKH